MPPLYRALLAAPLCIALLSTAATADSPALPALGASCPDDAGAGSLPVGAVVGNASLNGVSFQRTVSDINALTIFASDDLMGNGRRYVGSQPLGWVYRDDAGSFWLQVASGAKPSKALSAQTIHDALVRSFGVAPAAGSDAAPIGPSPGVLDERHLLAVPCFARGARFYPHEELPGEPAR